jgi:hypothetical protein
MGRTSASTAGPLRLPAKRMGLPSELASIRQEVSRPGAVRQGYRAEAGGPPRLRTGRPCVISHANHPQPVHRAKVVEASASRRSSVRMMDWTSAA